jgi:SAM-dependent methyltransferase
MANEYVACAAHSAEHFGDTRDHWYNRDFLHLLAHRWRLGSARDVLDVGAGVGHWGRLLGAFLPPEARVTGVDREPLWVEKASARARSLGLGERFHYRVGLVEALPFDDGSFDLVTCQTVLIHTRDPRAALAEMIRVTRPGGLVVAAEPNNAANALLGPAMALGLSPDAIASLLRFQLVCERGKAALGEGDNSEGERVPRLFAELGLERVEVHLNDKANLLLPPYDTAEQRAFADEITSFAERDVGLWSRAETRRYFLAGGGDEASFERSWADAIDLVRRQAAAIRDGTYATPGGGVMYLVAGGKPAIR